MPQTGSLFIRVFTSRAQLPIAGATVVVSVPEKDGLQRLLAIEQTNSSGLTRPIQLEAPDGDLSRSPGNPTPFASYTLVVEYPGYYVAVYEDLQVFAGIETVQDVPLTPLPQPMEPGPEAAPLVLVTPQPL